MANQQPLGPLGPDVAVTHILVVTDQARSRDFWVGVLGAELYREYGGTSVVLRLAGTWLLLVSGGGPTADKPTVVFQPPADADLVSHAMTVRVADCRRQADWKIAFTDLHRRQHDRNGLHTVSTRSPHGLQYCSHMVGTSIGNGGTR